MIILIKREELLTLLQMYKTFSSRRHFIGSSQLKSGLPRLLFTLSVCLFVFFLFAGFPTSVLAEAGKNIPSWGSGKYEVLVFSDYFCPPCQTLEPQIEPVLEEIIAQGGVKVTFVDLPVHKPTILYNRYYLYAANADADWQKVLHARGTLFQFAKQSPEAKEATEEILAALFKKEKVTFKYLDYKPIQRELGKIIKQHNVQSTPTCLVKYSESDIKTYDGVQGIMDGLNKLKSQLKRGKNE